MHATISRADALGTPEVLELHNADLQRSSVRGFTPIITTPDGRFHFEAGHPDAPQEGHEHLQGAFDGYDLDAGTRLSKAGHLAAAMGQPLAPDAPEDFRRGYLTYRPEDGERFGAAVDEERQQVVRRMYEDGLLPDRRRSVESQAHRVATPGWEQAMWLVVAYTTGLATPGIIEGLRALTGGAA